MSSRTLSLFAPLLQICAHQYATAESFHDEELETILHIANNPGISKKELHEWYKTQKRRVSFAYVIRRLDSVRFIHKASLGLRKNNHAVLPFKVLPPEYLSRAFSVRNASLYFIDYHRIKHLFDCPPVIILNKGIVSKTNLVLGEEFYYSPFLRYFTETPDQFTFCHSYTPYSKREVKRIMILFFKERIHDIRILNDSEVKELKSIDYETLKNSRTVAELRENHGFEGGRPTVRRLEE